ncbi:hypothetical protein EKA85_12960 [Pseudomonas veronii]|nr:hypothetical protein C1Y28_29175 [Pseudomonas sp. GW704-F5]RTY67028.1 hypothetical protein EKA85_12960 [Pseudomonas veronii]
MPSAAPRPTVGASLLAKTVNDNAKNLIPRGALRFFASKLAPTEVTGPCPCLARAPRPHCRSELARENRQR